MDDLVLSAKKKDQGVRLPVEKVLVLETESTAQHGAAYSLPSLTEETLPTGEKAGFQWQDAQQRALFSFTNARAVSAAFVKNLANINEPSVDNAIAQLFNAAILMVHRCTELAPEEFWAEAAVGIPWAHSLAPGVLVKFTKAAMRARDLVLLGIEHAAEVQGDDLGYNRGNLKMAYAVDWFVEELKSSFDDILSDTYAPATYRLYTKAELGDEDAVGGTGLASASATDDIVAATGRQDGSQQMDLDQLIHELYAESECTQECNFGRFE